MAKKEVTVCDLEKAGVEKPGTEQSFSIGGTDYDIDLCFDHINELNTTFQKYVDKARKRKGTKRTTTKHPARRPMKPLRPLGERVDRPALYPTRSLTPTPTDKGSTAIPRALRPSDGPGGVGKAPTGLRAKRVREFWKDRGVVAGKSYRSSGPIPLEIATEYDKSKKK